MEALSGIGSYAGIGFNLDAWDSGEHRQRREPSAVASSRRAASDTDATGLSLSPEKKEAVRRLEQRDREVRAHEQAHQAAAGGLALGGASFSLRAGPDGRMYAVGGEVQIDTSEESTPDATIAKARQIRAAANAPADPSSQDRAVAAEASRMESEARRDKAESETGRSSIGGPASLSGPPELSGPAASVSGPPQPLNRRTDELGRGDGGDVDGPFNAADYRRLHASAPAGAMRAAGGRASADAAYAAQSQAEAYARALDLEAQSRVDTASSVPLPPDADMLPPQTPPADAQAMPDLAESVRPVDPATVPAAGDYPPDRPSSALFAVNAAALSAFAAPDRSQAAAPSADADALRGPTETAEVLAAAMQRASRIYRRVSHVPTSLAPYGTGISQTV